VDGFGYRSVARRQHSKIGQMLGLVATRNEMPRKRRRQLGVDQKTHGYFCSRMISSENRFPLFGIMH